MGLVQGLIWVTDVSPAPSMPFNFFCPKHIASTLSFGMSLVQQAPGSWRQRPLVSQPHASPEQLWILGQRHLMRYSSWDPHFPPPSPKIWQQRLINIHINTSICHSFSLQGVEAQRPGLKNFVSVHGYPSGYLNLCSELRDYGWHTCDDNPCPRERIDTFFLCVGNEVVFCTIALPFSSQINPLASKKFKSLFKNHWA